MDIKEWGPLIYTTISTIIVSVALVIVNRMFKKRDEENRLRAERDKELNEILSRLENSITKLSGALTTITTGCDLRHQSINTQLEDLKTEMRDIKNRNENM